MTRYRKSWTQALNEVRESTEVKEAVLAEGDYKYDGKVVKISKKNFSKVHKDYKNSTKGKERMLINDPKTNGTISVPVQFEEVEIEEGTGLQMKMAFDDAKIKVKGVKGGKLVIAKKDKKKATDVLSKSLKKGSNVNKVIDKMIVFEDVELNEKGTAYPATIDTLRMIVKDKQHQTVMFKSGKAIVDTFTASAMVQVYDALKPALKKTFEKMITDKAGFMKTQAFAMKIMTG